MRVVVVRHAKAGERSSWEEQEFERSLNQAGIKQAQAIAEFLKEGTFTALFSSPYKRCVQTLDPLGDALGLEIKLDERLAENTTYVALQSFLLSLGGDGFYVACTHGNVAPELVEMLIGSNMERVGTPLRCAKGSLWDIEIVRGGVRRISYREDNFNTVYVG